MITHRMAAARLVDLVLVVLKGRIVEFGTREEVIQRHGVYACLWNLQAEWYAD
ncbi:hypothetical protein [Alicyclobacillus acidiphilus]|uniref:hypothetical protein n=1 Tax=Alicyclobacillus acidiphilus TaxID=182455 RepID=UPI000AC9F6FA|nr:hypothetical protein [Alicyclobacillus acidiphilus]